MGPLPVIAAGVFLGIVGAAGFIWSFSQLRNHEDFGKLPMPVYAGILAPIAFFLLVLLATEGPPPQFDALAIRPAGAASR